MELSRSPRVTRIAELPEADGDSRSIRARIYLDFPYIQVKGWGCRLRKQLEDSLAVLFVPHNMANSESTEALLMSKHRVFSNTSSVFKIKTDFTVDKGSLFYVKQIN